MNKFQINKAGPHRNCKKYIYILLTISIVSTSHPKNRQNKPKKNSTKHNRMLLKYLPIIPCPRLPTPLRRETPPAFASAPFLGLPPKQPCGSEPGTRRNPERQTLSPTIQFGPPGWIEEVHHGSAFLQKPTIQKKAVTGGGGVPIYQVDNQVV